MFKQFYHLTYNPFEKGVEVNNTYHSSDFEEAVGRLNYLKDTLGIGVFTGKPGFGKTTTLRYFANQQNPNLYKVIYVPLTTVSLMDFYRNMCRALDLEPKYRKVDMYRQIQERIDYLKNQAKITPILIIDEAQYLNTSILNDLKILLNFQMDSKNNAVLILAGLPILNNTLTKNVHEALLQRVTVKYNFEGITAEEVKEYVETRLKLAQGAPGIFDSQAITALANSAKGSVRVLEQLIINSLILGAQKQSMTINSDIIMEARNEINLI